MFEFLRIQCLLGAVTEEQLNRIVGVHITEEEHDELVRVLLDRTAAVEKG